MCKNKGVRLTNFDDVIEAIGYILKESECMTLTKALNKYGPDNIANLYDIARVKKIFHDAGRFNELSYLGIKDRAGNFIVKDHFNYMLLGEYLGDAPIGHPAYGQVIVAKVAGINSNNKVVPSDLEFAVCEDLPFYHRMGKMKDCGYITGFTKINGLFVPSTDGIEACEKYKEEKDGGYGTIILHDNETHPLCCRPCSWTTDLAFENSSGCDHARTIIERQKLIKIIGEKDELF